MVYINAIYFHKETLKAIRVWKKHQVEPNKWLCERLNSNKNTVILHESELGMFWRNINE